MCNVLLIVLIFKSSFQWTDKQTIVSIILGAFMLMSSMAYLSVSALSNLGRDYDSVNINNKTPQLDSESTLKSDSDSINRMYNSSITSQSPHIPFPGSLQIPYGGLLTERISPHLANILDLNGTRGSIITHVIPGSPAEKVGMQGINMTRGANTGEMIPLAGDIILAVDGSTMFTTDYDSIEQYIFENKKVGENISLTALRNGKIMDVEMTIESLPHFFWYEDINEGFKTKYPSDWTVIHERSPSGNKVVKFVSMEKSVLNGAPAANMSITRYLFNRTDPLDSAKPSESRDFSDFRDIRILTDGTTNLDKSPAYFTTFYDYSQENHALKLLTVFTVKNGQLYRIDFSAKPLRYDDYLPLATEMMKSFQFIG